MLRAIIINRFISPLKNISQAKVMEILISQMNFNKNHDTFDWREKLKELGYDPAFVDINFKKIFQDLTRLEYNKYYLKLLLVNSTFTGIEFTNCILPKFHDVHFFNCKFVNCTFRGLVNCELFYCSLNGRFESAKWDTSTFTNTSIENSVISDCTLSNVKFVESHLLHCRFEHCILTDIQGLSSSNYFNNTIEKSTNLIATGWDITHYNQHFLTPETQIKPIIVMLYSHQDGAANAGLLVKFLHEKNMDVVLVDYRFGFNHPVFRNKNLICGIILSGGPDVKAIPGPRERFEMGLLNEAEQHKLPLLGICRGHQFIGKAYEAYIAFIKGHQKKRKIEVSSIASLLHDNLAKKYYSQENENQKKELKPLSDKGGFIYKSSCLHYGTVLFHCQPDHRVKVTAKSDDGSVEALQVDDHIISFQHHNEVYLKEFSDEGKGRIAKANLNLFVKMVRTYYEGKHKSPVMTCRL